MAATKQALRSNPAPLAAWVGRGGEPRGFGFPGFFIALFDERPNFPDGNACGELKKAYLCDGRKVNGAVPGFGLKVRRRRQDIPNNIQNEVGRVTDFVF